MKKRFLTFRKLYTFFHKVSSSYTETTSLKTIPLSQLNPVTHQLKPCQEYLSIQNYQDKYDLKQYEKEAILRHLSEVEYPQKELIYFIERF